MGPGRGVWGVSLSLFTFKIVKGHEGGIVVLCILLRTALCGQSPLHGSGGGGKWGAILHIHIAFVALG